METIDPMKALSDSGFLKSGSYVSPQGMDCLKKAMVDFARNYTSKYFEGHIFEKPFEEFEKENYKSLIPSEEIQTKNL